MEKRQDVELRPYEHEGKKYPVFLAHSDLFKSPVSDVGHVVADSRVGLERKIVAYAKSIQGHYGQSLLVPIMRIDSSSAGGGFGLFRFRVMLPNKGIYDWHSHERLATMGRLPDTFPTKPAGLPFIDVPVGKAGRVYYAAFKERVWAAFQGLNARLASAFVASKNRILTNLETNVDLYTTSQLEYKLYLEYTRGI